MNLNRRFKTVDGDGMGLIGFLKGIEPRNNAFSIDYNQSTLAHQQPTVDCALYSVL